MENAIYLTVMFTKAGIRNVTCSVTFIHVLLQMNSTNVLLYNVLKHKSQKSLRFPVLQLFYYDCGLVYLSCFILWIIQDSKAFIRNEFNEC